MVIEELDFLKEDSNNSKIKWKARDAIKFIHTQLETNNERIKGTKTSNNCICHPI